MRRARSRFALLNPRLTTLAAWQGTWYFSNALVIVTSWRSLRDERSSRSKRTVKLGNFCDKMGSWEGIFSPSRGVTMLCNRKKERRREKWEGQSKGTPSIHSMLLGTPVLIERQSPELHGGFLRGKFPLPLERRKVSRRIERASEGRRSERR